MSYRCHHSAPFQVSLLKPSWSWYTSDTQLGPLEPSASKPGSICTTFTPFSFWHIEPHKAAEAVPLDVFPHLQAGCHLLSDRAPLRLAATASPARGWLWDVTNPSLFTTKGCRGPEIYINRAVPRCDVIYELSRSLSCANTGAATHLVQLRFLFHAGFPS